jgi:hypothetical protein
LLLVPILALMPSNGHIFQHPPFTTKDSALPCLQCWLHAWSLSAKYWSMGRWQDAFYFSFKIPRPTQLLYFLCVASRTSGLVLKYLCCGSKRTKAIVEQCSSRRHPDLEHQRVAERPLFSRLLSASKRR